nr:intercellular adhesion molecule 4 [Pogona vitticeps]
MVRPWHLLILPCALSILAGTAEEEFEVTISPPMTAVRRGDSVWLNCSSTCKTTSSLSLEARQKSMKGLHEPGWKSAQFLNFTEEMSHVSCDITCNGTTKKANATILTYKEILLKLEKSSPSQNLHQAYNLTCHVTEITALRSLSLTLLKGTERLHSWKFQDNTSVGLVNRTITHPLNPKPWDHGQEASCQMTFDLKPDEQSIIAKSLRLDLKTAVSELYRAVVVAVSSIVVLGAWLLVIFTYYLTLR